jgi:dCTP deaminase
VKPDYLWFLYQIGVEHTIRLRLYLDEVTRSCSRGEETLISSFHKRVDKICETLRVGINGLTDLPPGEKEIENLGELKWLIGRYRNAVLALLELDFDLTYLSTRPSISPEVDVFLSDSFPGFEVKPPVVYFPDYNFEETSIQQGVGPEILRMPYVEFRNPLMWANLIHEMGHALDASRKLTEGFFETPAGKTAAEKMTDEEKKLATDWVSEFFADQIGIAVAGPAYLLAFITWYFSSWYLVPDQDRVQAFKRDNHPLPSDRVSAMEEYLEQNDPLTDGVKPALEMFRAVETVFGKPDAKAFRPIGVSKEDAVSQARASLGAKLSRDLARYSGTNAKNVGILVKALKGRTTIPSRFSETLEKIRTEFESVSGRGFRDRNECFKVAEVLREEPNHPAEIINAGWEHKLTEGGKDFRNIFSRVDEDFGERFSEYERHMNNLERRLRKSIEGARVQKQWQECKRAHEAKKPRDLTTSTKEPPASEAPSSTNVESSARKLFESPRSRNELSLLTERQILERLCPDHPNRIVVTPILDLRRQLQPSSLDLRLGTEFALIRSSGFEFLDILNKEKAAKREIAKYIEMIHIPPSGKFVLHPGEFALGCTLEYIKLPSDIAGRLEGRSTWGRVGLQIHSTAGFVDPGFGGALTFELQNVGRVPIPLYPALRVAQICFYECEQSSIPYMEKAQSSYGGDPGLIFSRYYDPLETEILRIIHERGEEE